MVIKVCAVGKERLYAKKNNTIKKSTTDCFYWDAVYRLFNIMANYVTATAVGCLYKRWVAVRSGHIILHYVI